MKHILALSILTLLLALQACTNNTVEDNEVIEIVDNFSTLQDRLDSDTTKIWVVNFWATTCPPCIKEMPHFKDLQAQYDNEDLKVLLVSLDSPKSHEKRVIPFVEKHKIVPEVTHLVDDNFSAWTDKIDPSWFGALPATLIQKGNRRHFKFGMYESKEELDEAVQSVMPNS